jgi:hypothetical protein
MRERCNNPNHAHYDKYGGRGIRICERWDTFANFVADVGERPSRAHTLDRFPNPDGHYEPSNVRWATKTEQSRNRSNARLLTHNGRTQSIAAWADEVGVRSATIRTRLDLLGWDIPRALERTSGKQSARAMKAWETRRASRVSVQR